MMTNHWTDWMIHKCETPLVVWYNGECYSNSVEIIDADTIISGGYQDYDRVELDAIAARLFRAGFPKIAEEIMSLGD